MPKITQFPPVSPTIYSTGQFLKAFTPGTLNNES